MGDKEYVYDTHCGLYCGACPVLMANERGDEEWLQATAKQWKRQPEDLRCLGCKTEITAVFCTGCKMRACAREKGLEFCSECSDYPCEMVKDFRNDDAPHHSVIIKNLERIKEIGGKKWLAEQMERWTCTKCGTRFGWYTEKCEKCGAEVYNAVAEEKDLTV
ncbi:DUF3795 domain-containing protein [candidate division WOR-3 bacterium]|uniref:DUF3795 domain-containing protein n=1 Tax=candidate division WOR-3 bacterium TaxID=2052148 RepID=A0A9D5QCS8_UNCW3|nr:DUF3795 domain-containing protein [candidate division WOR-3 bacterium]MBD3364993.1 DUF3795 domain-containing protein [candidate division WOR-3 bacterium]